MTRFQQWLYKLGFGRFKRFRRWVGGVWIDRYIEPTPHSSECPYWKWMFDPGARFDDRAGAIEQWPVKLPKARSLKS
jgi:hypothetical protein